MHASFYILHNLCLNFTEVRWSFNFCMAISTWICGIQNTMTPILKDREEVYLKSFVIELVQEKGIFMYFYVKFQIY